MTFDEIGRDAQAQDLLSFARAALLHWPGDYTRVGLVKYRENAVFHVMDRSGPQFALRVHRPGYHSDAALFSELAWMNAMAEGGMSVPAVVPAGDGRLIVHVNDDCLPGERQVDMLTWRAGEPMGGIEQASVRSASDLERLMAAAGRLAADLHDRSARWAQPAGFVRHAWDAAGIIGPTPFWGNYLDLGALAADQRDSLHAAGNRARTQLAAIGQGAAVYGLIHADFVPENLLVSDGALTLIDFDDAGYGWYMFELATALFFLQDEPAYPELRDALFRGYRSVRSLGVDESLLPLFLFLRGLTYLSWIATRRETDTAREMTPLFVSRACALAQDYLAGD